MLARRDGRRDFGTTSTNATSARRGPRIEIDGSLLLVGQTDVPNG